jgi:DNA invertase Pin-like site-specific DNA recombinase
MSKKHAVLVVRVSTLDQDYKSQITDLENYAKTKGFTDFHIIETKESGLADLNKKVGTSKLFSFILENPKYNVVFVTEISRLGRRQSVLHQVKEWLVKNRVQLYVKDIGYTLFDENNKVSIAGDMMFSLYGLFAETEINQKKDRFSRAKKSLMEQGLSISGRTLFGYKRISLVELNRTTLIIDEENAEIVRTIFNWYLNGIDLYEKKVSIKRITLECIKLGFPKYTHSKRNINKLLKEEGYTGRKVTNNKRKNANYKDDSTEEKYFVTNNTIKYPIIINIETFNSVQEMLKENNTRIDKSTKNTTILSKLIKCNKCGNHYGGNYRVFKGRNLDTYRCNCRNSVNGISNTQSISMSMLDSAIWCLIKIDSGTLSKVISRFNPDNEIINLKKSIIELEKRNKEIDDEISMNIQSYNDMNKYKNLPMAELLNQMKSRLDKLDKEKGEILNEISKLKYNLSVNNIEIDDSYKLIKKNIKNIENSKEQIKKYINLFIGNLNIILHDSKYTIVKVNYSKTIIKMKIQEQLFASNKRMTINEIVDGTENKISTYILLDKRRPKEIKSYRTDTPIFPSTMKDTILFGDKNIKRGIKISLEELNSNKNNSYLKEFKFEKLNLYQHLSN